MFVQLWNLFSLELKTNKKKEYIHKYTRRTFCEEKNDVKFIIITVVESAENVYHATRQDLQFAHAS